MELSQDTGTSSAGRPTIHGDCASVLGRPHLILAISWEASLSKNWKPARKTAWYFDGVLASLCSSHIYFRSVQMVSLFWGSCWFVRSSFSLEIEFRMLDLAVRIFSGSVRMSRLLLRDLLVCAFARFPRTHNGVKPGHWNQQHRQTDHPGRLCCWWCDWSGATGVGGLVIRTLQNSPPHPPVCLDGLRKSRVGDNPPLSEAST